MFTLVLYVICPCFSFASLTPIRSHTFLAFCRRLCPCHSHPLGSRALHTPTTIKSSGQSKGRLRPRRMPKIGQEGCSLVSSCKSCSCISACPYTHIAPNQGVLDCWPSFTCRVPPHGPTRVPYAQGQPPVDARAPVAPTRPVPRHPCSHAQARSPSHDTHARVPRYLTSLV
jgi:hypothetical protein